MLDDMSSEGRKVMPRPTRVNKRMLRKEVAVMYRDSDAILRAAIPLLKVLVAEDFQKNGNPDEQLRMRGKCNTCESYGALPGTTLCLHCAAEIAQSILDELPLVRGEK